MCIRDRHIVAADFRQADDLLAGFHAFGDDAQVHPPGEVHNKPQDTVVERFCRFRLNKLHIQLQDVNGHLIEHIERRISGPKVVHFNDETETPQAVHRFNDLAGMLRVCTLRYFQMQPLRGKPVFSDNIH